ncbi:hypothetical protein [Chromobacterium vaccinii]|uniref:hypothetical protein n=1 Tax=Chromobacterium vaccinii TaxID=1108595 RepID=UPI00131A07F7|nr:hypothetical protein [Chromobacterium vaccinii]
MKPSNNPHKQITTKQHICPKSVLRRFMSNGKIQVLNVKTGVVEYLGLDADPFIAHRAWDQYSEHGEKYARIERQFGIIADKILKGKVKTLEPLAHSIISSMYGLWRIRQHRAANPIPDKFVGCPERSVSNETMDQGEHYRIITLNPNGEIPGRMLAGPQMQLDLERFEDEMTDKRWGIIHASQGEFVLPNSFGPYNIMPISPQYSLIANEENAEATLESVTHYNTTAKENTTLFLAARDLARCPGI